MAVDAHILGYNLLYVVLTDKVDKQTAQIRLLLLGIAQQQLGRAVAFIHFVLIV